VPSINYKRFCRDRINLAIDLTPLLPGGANGGIKQYIFEPIWSVAITHNNTEYICFTIKANVVIFLLQCTVILGVTIHMFVTFF
jgi:hypothetical protein